MASVAAAVCIASPQQASAQLVQEFSQETTTEPLVAEAAKVVQSFQSPGGGAAAEDDSETTYDLLYNSLEDWVMPEMTLPPVPAPSATRTEDVLDTGSIAAMTAAGLPSVPLPADELESLTSSSQGAIRMSLVGSVYRALQQNQALRVDKLRPEISNTGIESAESEFDTTLRATTAMRSNKSSTLGPLSRDSASSDTRIEEKRVSRGSDFTASLDGRLPTGTDYSLGVAGTRSSTPSTFPFYNSDVNVGITQNLLRGAGVEVNMVRIWAAQNNFVISLYQLQQGVIDLVADVVLSYCDLYLALETLSIRLSAYEVAKEQRLRTEEFVRVGKAPPLDYLSAQAEESGRISELIISATEIKKQQIQFARLINPECLPQGWITRIFPARKPTVPTEEFVADERVKLALKYRPDIQQAYLDLANGELDVVRTQNGLLPALDFFADAGLSGSGDSWGDAGSRTRSGDYSNWRVGLQFSYALQNRSAQAAYRRANFNRQLSEESILNLQQLVEVAIRTAVIDIDRTKRLIDSTKVTAGLRAEELNAETERYNVGRSTQLLVQQAQRDKFNADLNEVTAEVAHMRAIVQLYRAEGTILQRFCIQPVMITATSGADKYK